jgi:hypothetical protein
VKIPVAVWLYQFNFQAGKLSLPAFFVKKDTVLWCLLYEN